MRVRFRVSPPYTRARIISEPFFLPDSLQSWASTRELLPHESYQQMYEVDRDTRKPAAILDGNTASHSRILQQDFKKTTFGLY